MMADKGYASNGPVSGPVKINVEPDLDLGGFAYTADFGMFIPMDEEDEIDYPPAPLPQKAIKL
jgi:hypothetical protein